MQETLGSVPGLGKIPWKRKWQPTPVFLTGKSHGQRSLVGYSPRDCKKSEVTEQQSIAHIVEYYSALKRREILTCATIQINLENFILSEISTSQKGMYIRFHLYELLRVVKIIMQEVE